MRIVSDANTEYIGAMLDRRNLWSCLGRGLCPDAKDLVSTNHAVVEPSGRLRVRPYQPSEDPHDCPLCPVNMCKGQIVDRLLDQLAATSAASAGRPRLIYVGDGSGDFCACARMDPTKGDVCLARVDPAKPSRFGLLKRIRRDPATPPLLKTHADAGGVLRTWVDGAGVLREMRRAFGTPGTP